MGIYIDWPDRLAIGKAARLRNDHFALEFEGEEFSDTPEGYTLVAVIGPQRIYVCPADSCAFNSMMPGKCRSHPYPCRAMGPELVPLEVVPAGEQIEPAEAKNLYATFTGGAVDAALLDSVTPKLEALAGEELS